MIEKEQKYYPLENALKTAKRFSDILKPHCSRFHIAGSIRRGKSQVKDIEIVCTPEKDTQPKNMFETEEIISRDFIEGLATITYQVLKGHIEGRYMQILTCSKICPGIKLDLFMPTEHDYFRQLVIRTGSADYVHNIIASAWKRKGWCGVKDLGLRLISDCASLESGGKNKWKLLNADGEKPPAWQSEEEFYAWLGLSWQLPEHREFKRTINQNL